jgi:SAM-dependent methyltransferase
MSEWWPGFFDEDYIRLWGEGRAAVSTVAEVEDLWSLLSLREGIHLLDAPCGYGRISHLLAEKGAIVLGVDQSQALLNEAESRRGDIPLSRLRYLRHDLRKPLAEDGFDCAINIFTSLGYGTEEDDLAILQTLRAAVRPGGIVFVETNHRDAVAAFLARGGSRGRQLPDKGSRPQKLSTANYPLPTAG